MLFFALNLLVSSFTAQDCQMIVRFENYAVQSRIDDDLVWHGLDVDFAKALLDEAGCSYTFVSMPWGRSLKMLEEGQLDLVLSVTKTNARAQFAYFVGPQRMETIVFAMNAAYPYDIHQMDELFNLPVPIALQRGAFYGMEFDNRLKAIATNENKFIFVPDNQIKLSLLKHGRIAGFLEEKFNIVYQMENNPDFLSIIISPFVVNQSPVYFAFSKKRTSKQRLKRLEQAFSRLQKSGKLTDILKKYKLY